MILFLSALLTPCRVGIWSQTCPLSGMKVLHSLKCCIVKSWSGSIKQNAFDKRNYRKELAPRGCENARGGSWWWEALGLETASRQGRPATGQGARHIHARQLPGKPEPSAEARCATQQKPGKEGTRTRVCPVLMWGNNSTCAQIPVPEKVAKHDS